MDQHHITVKRSLKFKLSLLIGIMVVITTVGNWAVFWSSQRIVQAELKETRSAQSLNALRPKLSQLAIIPVILTVIIVFIGVLAYKIASHALMTPIFRMSEVAMQIAEGDLRGDLEVTSDDELGVLEDALLRVLEVSRAAASRLRKVCDQIKTASAEILNMSEEQTSISQKQANSIYSISRTMDAIADSSKQITENSDNVAQVAEKTLQATRAVAETVNNTITGMNAIQEQVEQDTERIVLLGKKVSQIGNVVKIINTIADHTKLIAFNASIEAAGAGETGGRFSVVATEVRRLANTVVESLEEIRNSVSSIQSATNELILSSEAGIRKVNEGAVLIAATSKTLQDIMTMLDQTTQSAREISIATQQQQAENSQIVNAVKEIEAGSEQAVSISKRNTKIAQELQALAEELDATVMSNILVKSSC